MGAGVMMSVMLGMDHAGRSHGRIHEKQAERQGPYSERAFESNEHPVCLAECRRLDRFAFLHLGHNIENQLLGQ
jgi:hypothetical protein